MRSDCCGIAVLLVLLCGCNGQQSEGPTRYPLSGSVTYDGKPVPHGEILFEPDATKGNEGPASTAPIKMGKYSLPSEKGVVGGDYQVSISGNDGVATTLPDGMELPHGKPLFMNHKSSVSLPKEQATQDFAIPAGQ